MLHIYLYNRPSQVRYGTTGWPVPGYELEMRGDDGQAIAPHADDPTEPGGLYLSGPSAALLYWANRTPARDRFKLRGREVARN